VLLSSQATRDKIPEQSARSASNCNASLLFLILDSEVICNLSSEHFRTAVTIETSVWEICSSNLWTKIRYYDGDIYNSPQTPNETGEIIY
jgi:hypothetical protein